MTIDQFYKGQRVHDLLPSHGYGEVILVSKTTVWVKFFDHDYKTIYDLDHLQFLNAVDA